jgi:hypothetical protein
MKKLKVKFVDFWGDLNNPDSNSFYTLLSQEYDVEFSDDPDILFYSNYGKEYLKYKCLRVFFSAENERPDFTACDYAITFDFLHDKRHLRFPLWALYYLGYIQGLKIEKLDTFKANDEIREQWRAKKKFCCFIVSNSKCKKRNEFFIKLNNVKRVDSAGRYLNNIGYNLEDGTLAKLAFIKDYRFVISFENISYPGYTTEKVFEPLLAGAIPIYWGNPKVDTDFNPNRILNYHNFKSEDELINRILEIDSNEELAMQVLTEKCFGGADHSIEEYQEKLKNFLYKIVAGKDTIKYVAQDPVRSVIHQYRRISKKAETKISYFAKRVISKLS